MSHEQPQKADERQQRPEGVKYGDLGVVGYDDMPDVVRERGATISQADVGGYRIITEAVGGQVISADVKAYHPKTALEPGAVTIGEALEAAAASAGDKPIDESDAAAIQAAEVCATGRGHILPGGVGAEAKSVATYNAGVAQDEQKYKLADVLADATSKLTNDKPVTREDAQAVIGAEVRNKPDLAIYRGGVAASVAAAARTNQEE